MNPHDDLPDFCARPRLILGCGNRLLGDDGFGPCVIDDLLSRYDIPDDLYVMDAGTGVRRILFTLCLSPSLPQEVVIVDAIDGGRRTGDIFQVTLNDVPADKADDFSLHQAPTSNLAKDLESLGVSVSVLACQVRNIPDSVEVGLTKPVARAVARMSSHIAKRYSLARKSHPDPVPHTGL